MSSSRDRPFRRCGVGEGQGLGIGAQLGDYREVRIRDPLGEVTVPVDQLLTADRVRELARSGRVVIAALHDLNLAGQFADRLALLAQGDLLVYDRPERVLTPAWLERAYKVSAVISQHPLYHTPMVALVESNGNHESSGMSG